MMAVGDEKARPSVTESVAVGSVLVLGLVWSKVMRPYDVHAWQLAVSLTVVSCLSAIALYWIGLWPFRTSPERRWMSAVWASTPWNSVILSQLAYAGYYFIPVEILASAILLRQRARLSQFVAPLLLATIVRFLSLGAVYALRPPLHTLFPWR